MSTSARKRRVLFFAEAVTLAHVARPLAMARALDPERYEYRIACNDRYVSLMGDSLRYRLPLDSLSAEAFLQALARGSPVYDTARLRQYVAEDRRLIRDPAFRPDLVVGDFRLSLSVSARLEGVAYAALTNAYWSPHVVHAGFPLPVLPMTRFLPIPAARALFALAQPVAFAMHCRPLNRVRAENGLAPLGHDLRRIYTDADRVLYADVPQQFPTRDLPDTHHFIGPVLWSPPTEQMPTWWDRLPDDKPVVYVTLGSSGQASVTLDVLKAIASLPVTVIASMAGGNATPDLGHNVNIAKLLPGEAAAARSSLVICNGGSPTSHQAIAAGVPVLGIASNMDQFMNMASLQQTGAGRLLRADRMDADSIRQTVVDMLATPGLRTAAGALRAKFAAYPAPANFAAIIDRMLDAEGAGRLSGDHATRR